MHNISCSNWQVSVPLEKPHLHTNMISAPHLHGWRDTSSFLPATNNPAIIGLDAQSKTYADLHKSVAEECGVLPAMFLPLFLIMQIIFPQGLTAVPVGTGKRAGWGCRWDGDAVGWGCKWDGDADRMETQRDGDAVGWGCEWDGDAEGMEV